MVTFEDDFQFEGKPYVKATAMTGLIDVYPIKRNGVYLFGGVDPVDSTWKISYVLYPKFQIDNSPGFSLESAKLATEKTDWASANTSCKICHKANKALGVVQPDQTDMMINEPAHNVGMEIQTPVQYSQRVTSRDIVPISALSNFARMGQTIACKPAGKLITSGFLATFFDYISGSVSDPGLKSTLDELAGKFLDGADICENDKAQLQKDLVGAYNTYRSTGSLSTALMSMMFRNVGDMLSGKGLAVTKTQKENKVVQTTYQVTPAYGGNMIG
jgi:hypothetical protein